MDTSFNGPEILNLSRIKTSAELNALPDGTRFLLVYNAGRGIRIASLQWNLPRTTRHLLLEDNGVLLPVYDDQQLQEESLYLLTPRRA
jgi:hypothetical protein